MATEKEKMLAGELYRPNDPEILADLAAAQAWLARYNAALGRSTDEQHALLRERCVVGPVVDVQGAGFLAGLRTRRPAKEVHGELLARDILTGTSADPNVVRILAPYVLEERHVLELGEALAELPP